MNWRRRIMCRTGQIHAVYTTCGSYVVTLCGRERQLEAAGAYLMDAGRVDCVACSRAIAEIEANTRRQMRLFE